MFGGGDHLEEGQSSSECTTGTHLFNPQGNLVILQFPGRKPGPEKCKSLSWATQLVSSSRASPPRHQIRALRSAVCNCKACEQ